jgi:hypothetical protein
MNYLELRRKSQLGEGRTQEIQPIHHAEELISQQGQLVNSQMIFVILI